MLYVNMISFLFILYFETLHCMFKDVLNDALLNISILFYLLFFLQCSPFLYRILITLRF